MKTESTVPDHQKVDYEKTISIVRDLSEGWLRRDPKVKSTIHPVITKSFPRIVDGSYYQCCACRFTYDIRPDRCVSCGCSDIEERKWC